MTLGELKNKLEEVATALIEAVDVKEIRFLEKEIFWLQENIEKMESESEQKKI